METSTNHSKKGLQSLWTMLLPKFLLGVFLQCRYNHLHSKDGGVELSPG